MATSVGKVKPGLAEKVPMGAPAGPIRCTSSSSVEVTSSDPLRSWAIPNGR